MSTPSKLSFQIEVRRVLEILSNDIYDSPYALLRENIQNAYDAILMRQVQDDNTFIPKIEVAIPGNGFIEIKDNGIGMNENTIANNFWKAGSSGKNTDIAREAGVIGTFGIGAMANFGVCKSLKVTSQFLGDATVIETFAKRESLSVSEECIEMKVFEEKREPGTTILAELDTNIIFNVEAAVKYLKQYVKYIPVPVLVNSVNISQESYMDFFEVTAENLSASESHSLKGGDFHFKLDINYTKQNQVKAFCYDIIYQNRKLIGDLALSQGTAGIYGLRNYFGLASIPISSFFNLGGVVNLSILHPTAGREALSRESIDIVNRLMGFIENWLAKSISLLDIADQNTAFQSYIAYHNYYDLAGNIKIDVLPDGTRWELKKIDPIVNGRKVYYYSGRDPQTISSFANENSYLTLLSPDNPRRKIQKEVLTRRRIEEVPDRARVLKVIDKKDLSIAQVSLLLHITNILNEDYLIPEATVCFAQISHGVPSLVEKRNDIVYIYLSGESSSVNQVLQTYETAWEVFTGFVKDLVRTHLYQKFSSYVPSSTKQGADALHKILMKQRELYKYELADLGPLESLLTDYVAGEIDFPEVLKRSSTITRTHSQFVARAQIGSVEEEIPSIVDPGGSGEMEKESDYDKYAAVPPIMREETKTDKKILKTDRPYQHLNEFTLFLSLSDKVYKSQLDFFLEPHTTKVIWSMHKIVYIFTHASNKLSLYYDIELKERLSEQSTGGKSLPSTTIITGNRIFIPIIPELNSYFEIKQGSKEFYVRYDIISDLSNESKV